MKEEYLRKQLAAAPASAADLEDVTARLKIEQKAALYIQKMLRGRQQRKEALAHLLWWGTFVAPVAHISMVEAERAAEGIMGRVGGGGVMEIAHHGFAYARGKHAEKQEAGETVDDSMMMA